MGAGGAHHRLLSSTTPPNASIFVPSCLPLFLSSYLPITFQLPFVLPSHPPDHNFHSTTESPTAPISQPSNHQATVEEANPSYSFYMECGGVTMTLKEPCPAVSWFGEFLK